MNIEFIKIYAVLVLVFPVMNLSAQLVSATDSSLNNSDSLKNTYQKHKISGFKSLDNKEYDDFDSTKSKYSCNNKSSSQNFQHQPSENLISPKNSLKECIPFAFDRNDSLTVKKTIQKKINTGGTLNFGYDYGMIPFVVNSKVPSGFFRTEGNVGFELFNLPLTAGFYYADVKTISGLNNYFRISFDEARHKENLRNQSSAKEQIAWEKLSQLFIYKQEAEQKLYYLKSIQNSNINEKNPIHKNFHNNNLLEKIKINSFDTSRLGISQYNSIIPMDTSFNIFQITDTTQISKWETGTLGTNDSNEKYLQKADSLNNKIRDYENKIKLIQEEINQVNQTIQVLKNPEEIIKQENTFSGKAQRFFSHIKKLDIGLCYPDYSAFLVSNTAVKGINIELEKENLFFAFTHGKIINNLIYSNNIVQNNLHNIRNLYNYFDFTYVQDGRKITAIKLGYGKKEGNHFHAGLLYGMGKSSNLNDPGLVYNSANLENNYVLEVDGKYLINPNHVVEISTARSSIQQDQIPYLDYEKGFSALLYSKVRSYATLTKYTSIFPKTQTQFTFTSRWIDPFFKSYGIGFIRSDNFRYEIKADQNLTKKIKISAFYRKEEDNLLSLLYIKTSLKTIGTNVAIRFSRRLTMRMGVSPVIQKVNAKDNNIHFINRNNISNIILTYTPMLKKIQSTFNTMYNYYQLYDGIKNNVFQNYSISNTTHLNRSVNNTFSANFFQVNNTDSLNGNTLFITNDITCVLQKGINLSAGLKWAQHPLYNSQIGYGLKITFPLIKYSSMELAAEKLVIGDFYNTYYFAEQINKFPYYGHIKLMINW